MSPTTTGSTAAPNPTATLTRTIALMNQKGGVGKTTTAVNLAAGTAMLGKRTLLIDLDPQGHASLHLGISAEEGPTAYELLLDSDVTLEQAAVKARDNLWVLPARTDMAGAEAELAGETDRLVRLKHALDRSALKFDFIFIDCPPSLGVLTLNGLAVAREVFIPMQAQFLAMQGLSELLKTVKLVGQNVNPQLRVTGVVLCVHDGATSHSKEVVSEVDGFFEASRQSAEPWRSARVYRPAVRRNVKLAEAPSFGKSIFEYEPNCPGAQDYGKLAGVLCEEHAALAERLKIKTIGQMPVPASAAAAVRTTGTTTTVAANTFG